jgi:aryl-alcohol dehydrogenase-like predicted oxidoreductase
METRSIGSLEVSVVGLGANNFGGRLDERRTADVVHAALDAGVNFIDTADVYGATKSEEFIGRAVRDRRDEVILATKFGSKVDEDHLGGAKASYVRSAVEESLGRLGTDRIDLYILHRPDPETPIAETLGALGELIASGKVREIGCSNFSVAQLREAAAVAADGGPRFVNLQNRYSLLDRAVELGILEECANTGIGFVPYSPLAGGLLSGKYRRDAPPPEGTRIASMPAERRASALSEQNFTVIESLAQFCASHDRSLLELAISWLLAQPAVASVISGATSPEQLRANVAAAQWRLSESELAAISGIIPTPS